jgi:hypothetical protein
LGDVPTTLGDVPSIEGMCGAPDVPAFTKFFGGEAIYAITPTDEATARHAVESMKVRPVQVWTVPDRIKRLPMGADDFELEVDEEGVPL